MAAIVGAVLRLHALAIFSILGIFPPFPAGLPLVALFVFFLFFFFFFLAGEFIFPPPLNPGLFLIACVTTGARQRPAGACGRAARERRCRGLVSER
jgi:hypothetical protein